ncbi:uncharacterized protein SPSK_06589 [Sporothrix schenckii 1099-18]|uniref:Uncharacterized protein n=1 Tax=Sporothrix schenckii 1099-18 TaxID=1397361 RepID=A0A0F2MKA9_SPOSC|nr:uncharacterized protein SPSK_06589 [Sporothrix schenckii 1099-18]KJR90047.1 hypothetical protein SPSK_06589 [Sporothrix schenckii 1099-18]
MACLVEGQEPESGLVDAVANGQQAVVLQDDGFVVRAQDSRDSSSFLPIEDNATKLVVHGMALVETEGILRNHVQWPPKGTKCLAVDGVRVAGGMHVRPRLVDFRVDGKRGGIDGLAALDDDAVFVDENEVGHADLRKVHRQRIQPEMVGQNWIAHRHVAGHALVEAAIGKYAEDSRQMLLAVETLFVERGKRGIGSNLQSLAGGGPAQRACSGVGAFLVGEDDSARGHYVILFVRDSRRSVEGG